MPEARSNRAYNRLMAVLLTVLCIACGGNSSPENGTAATGDTAASQTAEPEAPRVLTAGMKAGKAVYEQYCITCHQASGKGVSGLNPPLAGTDYVTGDKNRLISILLKGSNVGLEVNGMVYSNAMPPHAFLSDEDIADVLSYIRNSFGNRADTIAAEMVSEVRASL